MTLRHLYLHVPFCLRRCSYCDFAVHPTRTPPVEAWIGAVALELDLLQRLEGWPAAIELDTLYLGGGTPSLLGTGALAALDQWLAAHGSFARDAERTAEANPESFTPALARDWLQAGINRISLGVQSFHAPALRWMGRLHGADGARAAMATARAAGFDNVSLDLIFGLPAALGRDWQRDLEGALALEPDHISLYGLTAESGAALGRWVREGRAVLPPEDAYADEYLLAARILTEAGFEHYEVSNFARPGRESRHNRAYWNGAPYLGLGPGAHSYRPPERFWNVRDWGVYQSRLHAGELPREDREALSGEDAALERIWLELRTPEGARLPQAPGPAREKVLRWQEAGWAEFQDTRVRLTPAGWLLLDRLAVELGSEPGLTPSQVA